MKTRRIILYDEPDVPEINITQQKEFLESIFPVSVTVRGSIFDDNVESTRVLDLKNPFTKCSSAPDETGGDVYDGFELQQLVSRTIVEEMETLHVVFTSMLTATFSDEDFRYHARALIGSNPAIISTSGIVEGPARPKQYYLDLICGMDAEKRYKEQFLEYRDPRLSKIVEGYLLQAVFYFETGEAFCSDQNCRLFNAHWQKDLLESQLDPRLCDRHRSVLEEMSAS